MKLREVGGGQALSPWAEASFPLFPHFVAKNESLTKNSNMCNLNLKPFSNVFKIFQMKRVQ